ncbi:MAG: hypothetical protein QOH04_1399 [Sphingomonadales bacterium]|jgi:hypothetical protein|nr:hypothetical protein [Sphingomonadales bacterium]
MIHSPVRRRAYDDAMTRTALLLAALALPLGGCLAKTALDVVTLPVRAAAKSVDLLTASQKEADEKRGRAIREHEECLGKEEREARKAGREPDPSRCPEPKARQTR